jgi:hypothetical protein
MRLKDDAPPVVRDAAIRTKIEKPRRIQRYTELLSKLSSELELRRGAVVDRNSDHLPAAQQLRLNIFADEHFKEMAIAEVKAEIARVESEMNKAKAAVILLEDVSDGDTPKAGFIGMLGNVFDSVGSLRVERIIDRSNMIVSVEYQERPDLKPGRLTLWLSEFSTASAKENGSLEVRISVLIEPAELEGNRVLKATPFNLNDYIEPVTKIDAEAASSRPVPSSKPSHQ